MQVICKMSNLDHNWDYEVRKFNFDVYHLSGWLKASEIIDKGIAKGIIADLNGMKILFPVILRYLDNDYWDLTSAYGYGGPVYDSRLSHSEINIILEKIIQFIKQKNCVSWFIRLHPILDVNWPSHIGSTVIHGLTLSSDLTKSESEHWLETSKGHIYSVKKAMKKGVSAYVEKLDNCNINTFFEIYQETMQKVNALDFYFFNKKYFLKLLENLSENIILINAVLDGKIIASSMYLCCRETGIMQYHLSGTLNQYKHLAPSTLINHIAREWGRQEGYKLLHFGGGLGSNEDSLYKYKKGFSSQEHLFRTQRIIINENKYRELVSKNMLVTEYSRDLLTDGFFPLYRKK